jgi:hypothetical protein
MSMHAKLCPSSTPERIDSYKPGVVDNRFSTTVMREFAEYMSRPSPVLLRMASAGQEFVSVAEH